MNAIKFVPLIVLTTFLMGSGNWGWFTRLLRYWPISLHSGWNSHGGLCYRAPKAASRFQARLEQNAGYRSVSNRRVIGCIFLSLRTITASQSSILTFTNPPIVVILGT